MQRRGEEFRRKYEEAVRRHRESGDAARLAHALRHLGEVHTENGRLESAEECIREALTIYRPMPDLTPLTLANAVRPLALLREAQGRDAEARDAWSEARRLYAESGIDAGVAECDAHLGIPLAPSRPSTEAPDNPGEPDVGTADTRGGRS